MIPLLQNWVSMQAQRRPDAVAVAMEGQTLTYGQLEESTNQFARLLKAAGCRRGDRVCFAIPKSPAAIVAILGILKADCIHVPIDTLSPAPRVAKLLKSSEPRYLLGVAASAGLLEDLLSRDDFQTSLRVGWMDNSAENAKNFNATFRWSDVALQSAASVDSQNAPQDAAH